MEGGRKAEWREKEKAEKVMRRDRRQKKKTKVYFRGTVKNSDENRYANSDGRDVSDIYT